MLTEHVRDALAEEQPLTDEIYDRQDVTGLQAAKLECSRVKFVNCRLAGGIFAKASLINVSFIGCDLSGCDFSDSYWKESEMIDCRADGLLLRDSLLKQSSFADSSLCYAGCAQSVWDTCTLNRCQLKHAAFSQVRLKKTIFNEVSFSGADFFKTMLKDIDLSSCEIDGIAVSETFRELRGAKISAVQAPDLIRLLGVRLV